MYNIQTNFVNVEDAVSEDSLLAVLAVRFHVLCLYTTWPFNIMENNYANFAFLCFDFVSEPYSVPSSIFASALRCIIWHTL